MKGRVAVNSSKTSVMAFDQFRKRVLSTGASGPSTTYNVNVFHSRLNLSIKTFTLYVLASQAARYSSLPYDVYCVKNVYDVQIGFLPALTQLDFR